MLVFAQCALNAIFSSLHILIWILYEILQIQDEVGASPVEIARAYMGTRTSEIGLGSKSIIAKDERTFLHSDDIASNPFIASPSPKPPICWPGAMVQDQRSYLTPQGQRSRLGVNNFPRTPYSRTIFSKPHSKVCGNEFFLLCFYF